MWDNQIIREYNLQPPPKPTLTYYPTETKEILSLSDLDITPPYSTKFEPTEGDLYCISDESGQILLSSKNQKFLPKRHKFHDRAIYSLEWLYGSYQQTLITGSADFSLQEIDIATMTSIRTLKEHNQSVKHVSRHSSNESLVYSCSNDGSIKMWDLRKPKKSVWSIDRAHNVSSKIWRNVTCVSSLQSSLIVSSGSDGTVRLWDTRKYSSLSIFKPKSKIEFGFSHLAVSNDMLSIYASSVKPFSSIHRLSLRSDKNFELVSIMKDNISINSYFVHICLSPDDSYLLCGSSDNCAGIFDVNSGSRLINLIGHRGEVTSVDWNLSSNEILTASDDCCVTLWENYCKTDSQSEFVALNLPRVSFGGFTKVDDYVDVTEMENPCRFFEGIEESYNFVRKEEKLPTRVKKVVNMDTWLNVKGTSKGKGRRKSLRKIFKTVDKRQLSVSSYFK